VIDFVAIYVKLSEATPIVSATEI